MDNIVQGTPEWFDIRRGKITASRVADVIAKTKSGWGASRKNYLAELVAERLTGKTAESYSNAAMQWGTDTEPMARAAYEFYQGETVEEVGFIDHPLIANSGASPDGLVGAMGMVEIKCPNTATHINTLLTQKVPMKYITQMMWQMDCASRAWCDYVSYDPRMPERLAMFVKRLEADDERLTELRDLVAEFDAEVSATVEKLEQLTRHALQEEQNPLGAG